MTEHFDETPWGDPSWDEPSDRDNPLRAQLRRHQGWWRQNDKTRGPAGPHSTARGKPVVSMLEAVDGLSPNLMTDAAVSAATATIERLKDRGGPGLLQVDRLARNLLSSQPLCFNLFGHLSATPAALLPWIRSIDPEASHVDRVELEIAPTSDPIGGSAFDAFVEYNANGPLRFLGIECKYAESLAMPEPKQIDKYLAATLSHRWKEGAWAELNTPALRQFWFNTLLVHRVLEQPRDGQYEDGRSVVVAMEQDTKARQACDAVSEQMAGETTVHFSALQDVVGLVSGQESWKETFRERYLDLDKSTMPA